MGNENLLTIWCNAIEVNGNYNHDLLRLLGLGVLRQAHTVAIVGKRIAQRRRGGTKRAGSVSQARVTWMNSLLTQPATPSYSIYHQVRSSLGP